MEIAKFPSSRLGRLAVVGLLLLAPLMAAYASGALPGLVLGVPLLLTWLVMVIWMHGEYVRSELRAVENAATRPDRDGDGALPLTLLTGWIFPALLVGLADLSGRRKGKRWGNFAVVGLLGGVAIIGGVIRSLGLHLEEWLQDLVHSWVLLFAGAILMLISARAVAALDSGRRLDPGLRTPGRVAANLAGVEQGGRWLVVFTSLQVVFAILHLLSNPLAVLWPPVAVWGLLMQVFWLDRTLVHLELLETDGEGRLDLRRTLHSLPGIHVLSTAWSAAAIDRAVSGVRVQSWLPAVLVAGFHGTLVACVIQSLWLPPNPGLFAILLAAWLIAAVGVVAWSFRVQRRLREWTSASRQSLADALPI